VLINQAKPAEAEPYFRESLEKSRRVLGEEHPQVLRSIGNMGVLLASQGKLEAAEPYFRESVEKRRRVLGAGHPDTLRAIMNLTAMLANQGKSAEAEDCMRATLEEARRTLGEAHPDVLKLVSNMGALLQNEDKLAEAEVYYREAWEKSLRGLGVSSVATVRSALADLVDVLFAERKQQELIELLAPAEPAVRSACTGKAASGLGDLLVALGRARASVGSDADRFRLAEGNLVEAHEIFVKSGAEEDERAAMCAQAIVELYRAWNAAEPGKGHDAKADAWRARAKEREKE
jgi:non-specific serine/threonine protein kinase/serine/threonine-protein kinase